jgi:hypothetical protein
MLEDIET